MRKSKLQILRCVAVIWIALLLTCCAVIPLHPGAVDKTDSAAYDSLLVSQAALAETDRQLQAKTLPASIVPAFNAAIDAYNLTRDAWKTYRAAKGGDSKALLADVAAMTQAIVALQQAQGRSTP